MISIITVKRIKSYIIIKIVRQGIPIIINTIAITTMETIISNTLTTKNNKNNKSVKDSNIIIRILNNNNINNKNHKTKEIQIPLQIIITNNKSPI